MDLVREILLWATGEIEESPLNEESASSEEKEKFYSHVEMMIGAGLLEGKVLRDSETGGDTYLCANISLVTWKGQDLLDSIEDEGIWQKTKDRLTKVGGTASIDVVKSIAVELAKKAVGLEP